MKKVTLTLLLLVTCVFTLTSYTNDSVSNIKKKFTYTVSGTIYSCDYTYRVSGVTVKVVGTNIGTITDANGQYVIVTPGLGSTLSFSKVGAATATRVVSKHVIKLRACLQPNPAGGDDEEIFLDED